MKEKEIEYKPFPTAPFDDNFCVWAVCFDIDGKLYDDQKPRIGVSALFKYPEHAERFISEVLPAESRNRFYIIHI